MRTVALETNWVGIGGTCPDPKDSTGNKGDGAFMLNITVTTTASLPSVGQVVPVVCEQNVTVLDTLDNWAVPSQDSDCVTVFWTNVVI